MKPLSNTRWDQDEHVYPRFHPTYALVIKPEVLEQIRKHTSVSTSLSIMQLFILLVTGFPQDLTPSQTERSRSAMQLLGCPKYTTFASDY